MRSSTGISVFVSGGGFLLIIIAHAVTGVLAAWGTSTADSVYDSLPLPPFAPPAFWIGKIWMGMYAIISFALWLVWLSRHRLQIQMIIGVYGVHLLLQALLSWILFHFGRADAGLVDLVILSALSFWLMCVFWRVNTFAGFLMTIYQIWLCYVIFLSASILWLDGPRIGL